LAGIFKAGSAILNGDWAELGKILVNTTKKVWNGILGIIVDVVKAGTALMAKFFEFIGFENFGKKLAGINNTIADFIKNKFSFNIPVELEVKEKTATGGSTEEQAETKSKKAVKVLSEAAKEVAEIYSTLNKELLKNTVQIGFEKADVLEANINSYQKAIDALIDKGYKPMSAEIIKLIAKQKELLKLGFTANTLAPSTGKDVKLGQTITPVAKVDFSKAQTQLGEQLTVWKKQLNDFNTQAGSIISQGITDAFVLIGESIGKAFAGGTNVISNLANGLLSIVGSVATQLGKAAIAIGVGMQAIKLAFKNPLTAIAAGVALIALGSFISNKVANIPNQETGSGRSGETIRKFANGGVISGPTVGLMGEYAGARSNPEVVAPLNKLKGLIAGSGSGDVFIADSKLRGEDIYTAYKRAAKKMGDLG